MFHRTTRSAVTAVLAAALLAGSPFASPPAAFAQTAQAASIAGSVVDQQSGLALAGATVALLRNGRRVADARTDANGGFTFAQPPGLYDIEVSAQGYQIARLSDQAVVAGSGTIAIRIVLPRATTTQSGIREIGRVSATSRSALATTTVINRTVSAELIQSEANLRVGDALLRQPGLTSFSLDSAPGDDLNISIRGERPSESQLLIDNHPIGPIGVFNGTGGGFNYQLSPSFALRDLQITYGTGGSALTGVDSIAGTIDYETLEPTRRPAMSFKQGFGTQGRQQTLAQATGTAGKLGYVALYGLEGTYGGFAPARITQSGLLGGDATAANVAANTWLVTGNYILRNDLAKLRWNFSPSTALTATAYAATSWDDKTGEGDNDYVSPELALFQAQQAGNTCALPGGGTGYTVKTDADPAACFSGDQYAKTFSGPSGGTPLAFQTLRFQDYDARLTTSLGRHNVLVEGFLNNFYQLYDRNLAGFTNGYYTVGERISDDIVGERNTFGFGFLGVHQTYVRGTYGDNGVKNQPGLGSGFGNVFVRDIYNVTPVLQLFANANLQRSSVTKSSNFDPRLSLVFNPKGSDIYRVSVGRGSAAPTVQLKSSPLSVTTQPGALNPNCGGLNSIGSASNAGLAAETAKEIEVSYGHRFSADSQFQLVAYDQELANVIFSNNIPLASFGPSALPANFQQYLDRVSNYCQRPASVANFALTAAANAGAGRFRGVGATERYRFNRRFYADAGLDVLSARYFGIPVLVQQNNVTVIDGGQIVGVPFMKGNLGLDYTFPDRTEMRIDGYFVGAGNALYRKPYGYADGYVNHPLTKHLSVNLGVSNLFDSASDQYGRFGLGTLVPQNGFGSDPNAVSAAFNGNYGERFGLPQRSFVLSLTARMR